MGHFRYRQSIKLGPGVRLNLSRSGPSLSVGQGPVTLNYSAKGVRRTISAPGTGVSYSEMLSAAPAAPEIIFEEDAPKQPAAPPPASSTVGVWALLVFICLFALGKWAADKSAGDIVAAPPEGLSRAATTGESASRLEPRPAKIQIWVDDVDPAEPARPRSNPGRRAHKGGHAPRER